MTAQAYTTSNKKEVATTQLAEAVAELTSSEDWLQALRLVANLRTMSFRNVLLLQIQCEERGIPLSAVKTYQGWRKLGRQVRKGEQALWILEPLKYKAEDSNGDEYMALAGFKMAPRFDISQTMGEPVKLTGDFVATLTGDAPSVVPLIDYIENELKFQFVTNLLEGDVKGSTHFGNRSVTVDAKTDAELFAVTLHEIGHAMLHDPKDGDYPTHRGIGEVEAESFAYIVGSALGVDTAPQSLGYIAGWASDQDRKPSEIVLSVGDRVVAAARRFLDYVTEDSDE